MKTIFEYWICILFILAIVGCHNSGEETLQLTVANQYIKYVDTTQTDTYLSSYNNDMVRRKAINIITYTISNPTDKKYLLVFDTESPEPAFSEDYNNLRSLIGYRIINNKNKIKKCNPGIFCGGPDLLDCRDCILRNRMDEYNKLGITTGYSLQLDNYIHNAVTIYPGEKRTFKSVIMLPIVLERNEMGGGIMNYNNLTNSDKFELFYHCNALNLKAELPKYILDELEYNNIEIFDGLISASKVPLKVIK